MDVISHSSSNPFCLHGFFHLEAASEPKEHDKSHHMLILSGLAVIPQGSRFAHKSKKIQSMLKGQEPRNETIVCLRSLVNQCNLTRGE